MAKLELMTILLLNAVLKFNCEMHFKSFYSKGDRPSFKSHFESQEITSYPTDMPRRISNIHLGTRQTRKLSSLDSYIDDNIGSELSIKKRCTEVLSENDGKLIKKESVCYNGGKVLTKPINVYLIWYGDWEENETEKNINKFKPFECYDNLRGCSNFLEQNNKLKNIIRNFIRSINFKPESTNGETPSVNDWWSIVSQYSDTNGTKVTREVNLAGEISDDYSRGLVLENSVTDILSIVTRALNRGLNFDSNGFYAVLSSKDVQILDGDSSWANGFCKKSPGAYCGWHHLAKATKAWGSEIDFTYAFIGDASLQCPFQCIGKYFNHPKSVNQNWGVDGMIKVLAHELAEAATDPDCASGWQGRQGEIGDLCNQNFGSVKVAFDENSEASYVYNVVGLSGQRFFIQALWDAFTESCKLKL